MATIRPVSPWAAATLPAQRAVQPRSAAQAVAQHQQPDQRLGVAAAGDRRVELVERARLDRDPLVLDLVARRVGQARGEVDVALLVGEAGRGEERRQVLPAIGRLPDLLGELAAAALERALPRLVELAGGQLEQVVVAGRL